jgi:hypothetical protein
MFTDMRRRDELRMITAAWEEDGARVAGPSLLRL